MKGRFSCFAKFIVADGVRESTKDVMFVLSAVVMQIGVFDATLGQKPFPAAKCSRLLGSGFLCNSVESIFGSLRDSIQEIISFGTG